MSLAQPGAPQGPVLDMLWRQLHELNAVIDYASTSPTRPDYKVMETEQDESVGEDLKEDTVNQDRLRGRLEELRDTTRRTINEAVRPFLRPLNILDLPDELLCHVFLYVRERMSMYKLAFYELDSGNVEQIKKLRLTCKRFCATSSHLLMLTVTVSMNAQSLAHLDRVSRHPTISKGIRTIKICLGDHFDRDVANDVGAFARYQGTKLRNCIDHWQWNVQNGLFFFRHLSREFLQKAIGRAVAIADSFDEAVRHGLDETCSEHVLLRTAQECYRQQYESQLLLQRGHFVQAIVSAMMQMPAATCLSIQDGDNRAISSSEWNSTNINPEDLDDLETLRLKLQAPSLSWFKASCYELGSPPVDMVPSILSSVGEAGISLAVLDIDVPTPDDLSSFSTDQLEPSKSQASSQKLKAFAYRPRDYLSLSTEAVPLFTGFLFTLFETSSLQRIHLCFDFMYKRTFLGRPTTSMAPILLSRPWPNLKELSFNGPFQFQDLRKLVKHIDKDVELEWCGFLMDGSWAEVLDFLRDCRLHATITLGDMNGSIAGAEVEECSMEGLDYIFGEGGLTPSLASKSRAVGYLRGWTTRNPVIDWANGYSEWPMPPRDD